MYICNLFIINVLKLDGIIVTIVQIIINTVQIVQIPSIRKSLFSNVGGRLDGLDGILGNLLAEQGDSPFTRVFLGIKNAGILEVGLDRVYATREDVRRLRPRPPFYIQFQAERDSL